MKREQKLPKLPKWNVWTWSFNHDRLEEYDVVPMMVRALKSMKPRERPQTLEELSEVLSGEARYYFWAKCEYELIVHGFPEREEEAKVDVYDQLKLNWDIFSKWFWANVYKPFVLNKKKVVKK